MAEPTSYTVTYDFSGFQASNPQTPLPASPLDTEFDNVATSIASIIAALANVRRSDGRIANEQVTYDSLDAQVKALLGGEHDVTIADLDPTVIALQPDAEGGVANDKLMTPLRTKQAVDSYRAFASQGAAQAGAETTTVMSPARTKDQLDALRAFASEAEAEAGTEAAKVMSPLRTADAIAALRPAFTATAELTWAEIADGDSATQTITVAGAVVGMPAVIGYPATAIQAKLLPVAWVSAADTVSIRISNVSGGALTPTAGEYTATVIGF